MILSTHALAGAVIGKNIGNPWLVILLSLVVHFFMDTFRHGEYFDSRIARIRDTWWKVALDLLVVVLILSGYFVWKNPDTHKFHNILLGAFFSVLPDSFSLLFWKYPHNFLLAKIKRFHEFCHRYHKWAKHGPERQWTLRNAANDIIFSILAIIFLFF